MFTWFFTQTPLLYLTQSLWRDETFSVLMAEHSFWDIIKLTTGDYTPPLYYMLLKIWILFFGRSEVAIRMLSFIFYCGMVYVGYKFSNEIICMKNKWFPWVTTFLLAINPMLLYFAFEARTYSLVAFLVLLSSYFFMKENWKGHAISSVFALYAHPYSIFALVGQTLYVVVLKKKLFKTLLQQAGIISLFYLPWLFVIFSQILKSSEMWYYPVTSQVIRSLIASMYLGYEGTPEFLWKWVSWLSLLIGLIIFIGMFNKKIKDVYRFLLISFFLPIVVVMGISLVKPIFTPRYIIYTTVVEVFVISLGLFSITNKYIRVTLLVCTLCFTLFFNIWYPAKHPKLDFKTPFQEINSTMKKDDIILNESSLTFFNAQYYAKYPKQVFLLKSDTNPLPNYVGAVLIPNSLWIKTIPTDKKVFFLHEDGTYDILNRTLL